MTVRLGRVLLYVRDIEQVAAFYQRHFDFQILRSPGDRIVELIASDGGLSIMLHQAAKSQKMGQVLVKLVFDVQDVESFVANAATNGLIFSAPKKADGYSFANAKDPSGNSISISSRAFRVMA